MTIFQLVQSLTDQSAKLYTTPGRWFPLWRILTVRKVNRRYVITNEPYVPKLTKSYQDGLKTFERS